MEDLYYTNREQEIRLSRIVFLKGKLAEAAKQLEFWRQEEDRIYRMIQRLEQPTNWEHATPTWKNGELEVHDDD